MEIYRVGIWFFIQNKLRSIFSNYHTMSFSLNNTTWEKDIVPTRKSQEIENFMELARR